MISSPTKSHAAIWIWGLAFCCSVVLVVFAYNMYPVPDGDAIGPVPAIKAYATSGILQNNLFLIPSTIDPSGQGRYLAYPPGMPLFFGSLMTLFGAKSIQGVIISLSLARCASLFVFTKVITTELIKHTPKVRPSHTVLAMALVASNAFFLFASNGRAEILAILIITLALWSAVCINTKFTRHIIIQICVGLLFPVSIATGLIGACIYFIYLLFDIRGIQARIQLSILSVFLCIIIFALSYVFVGVPLQDGIQGIARHASNAVTGYTMELSFSRALGYYRTWLIFGILAVLQFGQQIVKYWRGNLSFWLDKLPLIISCLALAILAYYFGGRFATQHYNLYAFLPIYQLLAFQLATYASWDTRNFPGYLYKALLIIAAVLSLLQPIQAIFLFPYYLISGATYSTMKNNFEKVKTDQCHVVYTIGISMLDEKQSGSMYNLDNNSKVSPTERMKIDSTKASCVYAFVQEVNNNSTPPKGMQMVADFSDRSNYTLILRRLRLLNSPKGYSFRAYKGEININQK